MPPGAPEEDVETTRRRAIRQRFFQAAPLITPLITLESVMYRFAQLTSLAFVFATTTAAAQVRDRAPIDPAPVAFERGDANADGSQDISDVLTILLYLFDGSVKPTCLDALDADDSGGIVLTDPLFLLRGLFLGGEAPPAPFGRCGSDPTADRLGCESYAPCGVDEDPSFDVPTRPRDESDLVVGKAPAGQKVEISTPEVTLQEWDNTVVFRVTEIAGVDSDDVAAVRYWVDGEPVAYSLPGAENYYGSVYLSHLGAGWHWVGAQALDQDWQPIGISAVVWFLPRPFNELLVNGGFENGAWDLEFSDIGPHATVVENVVDSPVAFDGQKAMRIGGKGEESDTKVGQVVAVPLNIKSLDFSVRVRTQTEEWSNKDNLWVEFWNASTFEKIGNWSIASSLNHQLEPGQGDMWRNYSRPHVSLDAGEYAGKKIIVILRVKENYGNPTSFYLDNASLRYEEFGLAP